MIIGLLNQKGGSGKSTIAIHLSHALALKGFQVLLVDSDPQGSSRDWAAAREGESLFSVVGIDRPTLDKELPKLAKGFDYVVIDGAPRVSALTKSAIMACDLVLIPVSPSPLDIWASNEVVQMIEEASIYKTGLAAAFVVNRKIPNTTIGKDVFEVLGNYSFPVLASAISQRVGFAEALNSGSTVLETTPKGPGAEEITNLANEILEAIENG